ncbi:MAG: 4'-phosphopantetheinyl transferase superfamily protein [Gammaproteobacteria bacterium]|nr:4'-phosphopantetheinyl transferase superfamily protein [Gammaproteobacteria bacterium]
MSVSTLELCFYRMAESFKLTAEVINRLDSVQQLRLANLSPSRQRQFVVGRILLVEMLQHFHGLSADDWRLEERQGSPPKLTLAGTTYQAAGVPKFSISHSGDIVTVAICKAADLSPCHVGVDIEAIIQRDNTDTANYFCSPPELQELATLSDLRSQLEYMTRVWTRKEAFFKAYELPILNPRITKLCMVKSAANQGSISTSTIDKNNILSVYCPAEASISTQRVIMDRQGKFARLAPVDLLWESFRPEFL